MSLKTLMILVGALVVLYLVAGCERAGEFVTVGSDLRLSVDADGNVTTTGGITVEPVFGGKL